MSRSVTGRKITGLSPEKWTLHQLKALQPQMLLASKSPDGAELGRLVDNITQLFTFNSVDSVSSNNRVLKFLGAELLSDLIKTLTVFHCQEGFLLLSAKGLSYQLGEEIFSCFTESDSSNKSDNATMEGDDVIVTTRQASSLSTLANLGSIGFEENATMLLDHLCSVLGANDDVCQTSVQRLVGFTVSYLKFLQSVMNFHNNRKKLYTNICEVLLPSVMKLLNVCHNATTSTYGDIVRPLQSVLSEVIEKGLFDEKNVEELATLHLSSSTTTSNNNSSKHSNKKQKGSMKVEDNEDVEVVESSNKSKGDSIKNKSFHDTLFRVLEGRYYTATEESSRSNVQNENIVRDATSYACGVAHLFKIYCSKSASIALQTSTQQTNAGYQSRGGANARNESLGTDAVNSRKHLVRVFHFLFQLIEAFRANQEGASEELLTILETRARTRKTVVETAQTPSKKRKSEKASSSSSAEWSAEMVTTLKARILRNVVLAACVEIVNQQAIPNHDSLFRYVELLVGLSVQSVKDCGKLQVQLEGAGDAVNPDSEFVHEVLTTDLQCVRLVALIDHTTVVDHRLRNVVQALGAPDLTQGAKAEWVANHYQAKLELFRAVIKIHGDLRLLDHLVAQLTVLDKLQASPPSMLRQIISSNQVSKALVSLFAAAPIGQLPQHWANLSGPVDSKEVQVGVITCCLARALMEAQLHSVRSNINVFGTENAGSADAVDANTVNMTLLLWRLSSTVKVLVSASKSAADDSLTHNVLSTLSVLLRFVAHFHAGTIKQLVVPCIATAAADDKTDLVSFHGIAMNMLLNNLIALRLGDASVVSTLRALLSLVLLNSNITAKNPAAALGVTAQTTILSKYTIDVLSGIRSGSTAELSESTQLDLLHLILCDIRIWSQFNEQNGVAASSLQPKKLVPLFQLYIHVGARHHAEGSSAKQDIGSQLSRIAVILASAAVADNRFIQEVAHAALQSEWLALQTSASKSSRVDDATTPRTTLLSVLHSLFGIEFLYSATFFMPSVFAHLVATCSLGAKSGGSAHLRGALAASDILLGHLRSAPSSRASSHITGYPAKPTVLDSVLYILSGKASAVEPDVSTLDSALDQVYNLARSILKTGADLRERGAPDNSSLILVCLLLDNLLSRLVQVFNADNSTVTSMIVSKAVLFVKEVAVDAKHCNGRAQQRIFHTALSCFVSAPVRKIENSSEKDVNPSDALIVSALQQIVTQLTADLLSKQTTAAPTFAEFQADNANLQTIGEAVVVISAMVQKSKQASLAESAQSDVIKAMFLYSSRVLSADLASHPTTGWLYLFGSLSDQILLRFAVVTLPQITEAPAADMFLPVTVSLAQLELLFGVLHRMLTCELSHNQFDESAAESTALTMPVVSLLTSLLNAVLISRMCNCEPHQVLASLKSFLLVPLQRGDSAAQRFAPLLCRDLLIYFTDHGRKLLPGGKLAQEKFQQFHECLIDLTVGTYQDIIAGHSGQTVEDVNQLAAILYHTNCVTATVSAVLQRQGRGGARRKNKENDTKSSVFRCDLWFDGLLSSIALITSHMHVWQEPSAAGDTPALSSLECNASTVLLSKSLLQNVERLVAVSTSSSLPNLNTAIGAIVLAITTTMTLLQRIENACVTNAPAVTHPVVATAFSTSQVLQLNLNSCYHLICRVLSTIAGSQVLEKHVHFIACAAVEAISKTTVSRPFQEIAYPGIYSLFEKCQSRQKTQMFAMLDTQSRTLMTDLHDEFMRSFKFVGK